MYSKRPQGTNPRECMFSLQLATWLNSLISGLNTNHILNLHLYMYTTDKSSKYYIPGIKYHEKNQKINSNNLKKKILAYE